MDNWDTEDVQPKGQVAAWEGEDEDDDLKDNWDDDDEEEKQEVAAPAPTVQPKKGGKQYLKQKLKEKEEQERLKMERRIEEEANKTPEEKMREKLLAQKLAEESDLEVTKEMFGMDLDEKKVTLDNFQPRTKEDFTKISSLLKDKFTSMESSPHYFFLLQDLLSSALVNLETDRLKQLSSSINVLYTEKLKQERQKKGGKKTQKAKLGGGVKASRQDAMEDFSQYNNDFDDFM